MDYWLLLGLVYTTGFTILIFQSATRKRTVPYFAVGVGFMLLAMGLATEIILRFELQVWAARSFYWARTMLALAWLGHGYLLLNWPKNRYLSWATKVLIAGSLLSLMLVLFAEITRAEDWFVASKPIYTQLGDLLATNRPMRWGGLLLNLYGTSALVGGTIYAYATQKKGGVMGLRPLFIIAGTLFLLLPVYWPPQEASTPFFFYETLAPIFLFLGITRPQPPENVKQKKKRKSKR